MIRLNGPSLARVSLAPLLLCVFCSSRASANAKAPAPDTPVKWEYKMVPELTQVVLADRSVKETQIREADLNKLGDDGWELCGVMNKTISIPGGGGRILTEVHFIFKRPKREK